MCGWPFRKELLLPDSSHESMGIFCGIRGKKKGCISNMIGSVHFLGWFSTEPMDSWENPGSNSCGCKTPHDPRCMSIDALHLGMEDLAPRGWWAIMIFWYSKKLKKKNIIFYHQESLEFDGFRISLDEQILDQNRQLFFIVRGYNNILSLKTTTIFFMRHFDKFLQTSSDLLP